MAATFDVAARLAEGRSAVSDFENYVWACQSLGYQNPDLTTHSSQVQDLYGAEDGLDLGVLEADGTALSGLASLADEALRTQSESMLELFGAWEGQAARAARDYLRRHQDAAEAISAAVHVAVGALSQLRDQLWQAVDEKVDTVLAIDDRAGSERAEWLAAAHTVLAGVGDRATASETVDQHLRPFVETAIGSDWVSATRATTASVAAAYDTAIAAMRTDPFRSFDVPGYLGPALGDSTAPAASTSPVASISPAGAIAAAPFAAPAPAAAPVTPAPVAADPMPPAPPGVVPSSATPMEPPMSSSMPPLGDLGGMSGLGAGMSGLGRQLAEGIGDLTAAGREALPNDLAFEQPDGSGDAKDDAKDDAEDVDPDADAKAEDDEVDADEADADEAEESEVESDPTTSEPTPTPTPTPEPLSADLAPHPHVVPEPPAEPAERTPCEIAADEVPQVGE